MSKNKKKAIKRFYLNWREARKSPKNKPECIKAFFMGGWVAMTDDQVVYFFSLLTKKDRKEMMKYPIWM